MTSGLAKRMQLRSGDFRFQNIFARRVRQNSPLRSGILFTSPREIMLFIGKPKGRSMMISNATNPLKESRKNLY